MTKRHFTIAFLAGVAVGAVVALLYAPQSGARTRKDLANGLDKAGRKLSDAGESIRTQAENVGEEAQKAIDRTRKQVETVLEQASDAISATLKQASKAFNTNVNQASAAIESAIGTITQR